MEQMEADAQQQNDAIVSLKEKTSGKMVERRLMTRMVVTVLGI